MDAAELFSMGFCELFLIDTREIGGEVCMYVWFIVFLKKNVWFIARCVHLLRVSVDGWGAWPLLLPLAPALYGEAPTNLCHKTREMFKFMKLLAFMVFSGRLQWNSSQKWAQGSAECTHSQMVGFPELVDLCGLVDIDFSVKWRTHEKKVAGCSLFVLFLTHLF